MVDNLRTNKILWFLNGLLALLAAVVGVANLDIYDGVVGSEILPGVLSQDILTILAALLLLFLTFRSRDGAAREQIVILGILGYIFYAYGIYAIEQVYNSLYFLYLALLGLSFYTLIYSVASIHRQLLLQVAVSDRVRRLGVGYSLFIAIFFSLIWVMQLVPLLQTGDRIDNLHSIFILDLSFIMPAFAILAIMAARKQGLGLLLTPALYVLGATLLFPVGLGELFRPYFDGAVNTADAALFLGISALFLIMAIVYLRALTFPGRASATTPLFSSGP
jgi:hypothetical protein